MPLLETVQRKRRFLVAGLITLSTLAWRWTTSTSYDIRLLLRGNRYIYLLEYESAISIDNQAINEFSSNSEIRVALALAYKMSGDYNHVITEYETLISNNPDNVALHNNLGKVYYRKWK